MLKQKKTKTEEGENRNNTVYYTKLSAQKCNIASNIYLAHQYFKQLFLIIKKVLSQELTRNLQHRQSKLRVRTKPLQWIILVVYYLHPCISNNNNAAILSSVCSLQFMKEKMFLLLSIPCNWNYDIKTIYLPFVIMALVAAGTLNWKKLE